MCPDRQSDDEVNNLPEDVLLITKKSEKKISIFFKDSFFEDKGLREMGDIFELVTAYQHFELFVDLPLGRLPKSTIEELTRGKCLWCMSGVIRKDASLWRLNLRYFISRTEIKPRYIDITIQADEEGVNPTANWIHRVRADKHGYLLSVDDLEALDFGYHGIYSSAPVLMHLRDVAKPGEIFDMDATQAEEEGHASCVFVNKSFNTVSRKPDLTHGHTKVIKIEVNEEIVSTEYAEYFLNENLKNFVGTSMEFITKDDICGMPIVVPTLQVQRVVCDYVVNLEKYKNATRERARKFSEIRPLEINPSKLLGHSLSLLEESAVQSSNDISTLPSPISQVLAALQTNNKERRFLCSLYLIEVIIQFHVVTACALATKLLGRSKLEEAYKTFQSTKWRITLATWKDIFESLVSEFEKCVKSNSNLNLTAVTETFGEESFFAFSDLYSKQLCQVFKNLISIRNAHYGHPSFPPVEAMDNCSDIVSKEATNYIELTRTLWKWLAAGICKEVPTDESGELIASIEELSGSFKSTPNLSMIVPPGLLARNAMVFYPRMNPTSTTIVQGIPVTFVERISSTVHGLYFFSRLVEDKLVFQSYSELKESTKEFSLEDPRIALLAKRIASSIKDSEAHKSPSKKNGS